MKMTKVLLPILGLLLSACANLPTIDERRELADELARQQGWQSTIIQAAPFELVAYLPTQYSQDDHLTIYIEGDGFAWVSASQPSLDPTPRNPTGLRMALAHPNGNAAYLARPCQYIDAVTRQCPQRYWTGQRFAPEVIEASSHALDAMKAHFQAQWLTLVGYSGGGAVAALLAARRHDVVRLVTVAGNLDHSAWTRHHGIMPLTGSLNPADERKGLASIPQIHFAGSKDRVVPLEITRQFVSGLPPATPAQVRVMAGYDHSCCWSENWADLWTAIQ